MMTAIECRQKILEEKARMKHLQSCIDRAAPGTWRGVIEARSLIVRHEKEIMRLEALLPTLE